MRPTRPLTDEGTVMPRAPFDGLLHGLCRLMSRRRLLAGVSLTVLALIALFWVLAWCLVWLMVPELGVDRVLM